MLLQIESFGSNMAPLGRAGMPAEYGPAAVFLADNGQSSFVSPVLNLTLY